MLKCSLCVNLRVNLICMRLEHFSWWYCRKWSFLDFRHFCSVVRQFNFNFSNLTHIFHSNLDNGVFQNNQYTPRRFQLNTTQLIINSIVERKPNSIRYYRNFQIQLKTSNIINGHQSRSNAKMTIDLITFNYGIWIVV